MEQVAGSSSKKGPPNATAHCQSAEGCGPVNTPNQALTEGNTQVSNIAQAPMTASHPAYQRAGFALAAIRRVSASEPKHRPPKNAAITASTATMSWPSQTPNCSVQTI